MWTITPNSGEFSTLRTVSVECSSPSRVAYSQTSPGLNLASVAPCKVVSFFGATPICATAMPAKAKTNTATRNRIKGHGDGVYTTIKTLLSAVTVQVDTKCVTSELLTLGKLPKITLMMK